MTPRLLAALILSAGVAVALLATWRVVGQQPAPPPAAPRFDLSAIPVHGFPALDAERPLRFPRDHGAHPGHPAERWFVACTLTTASGRRLAFGLSLYRIALGPTPPTGRSAWAAHQIYRGELGLTDAGTGIFREFERMSREAFGLSGAENHPVRVWVEDWSLAAEMPADGIGASFRIRARGDGVALALNLEATRPPLEDRNMDRFTAPDDGPPLFRFYVLPGLKVTGELKLEDSALPVSGTAWLDHAWGELPLAPGAVTLDRFVLQLGDQSGILCLAFRRRDTGADLGSDCLHVPADTRQPARVMRSAEIEGLDHRISPVDGTRYPSRWRLRAADPEIDLRIVPLVPDQVIPGMLRRWSGAVTLRGHAGDTPLDGYGHVDYSGDDHAQSR